ncbi:MATE family efflux transporter [Candidatus Saccharibacteria bacterium]|nr:MATE family efflux transporter [Candidatus Saccharibacteria bacterium]
MDEDARAFTQHFTLGKLFKYVLPTIFAILIASVYGIVDGIFVSNFGGTTPFAAINQVSPIFMIIAAIGFMFGTGGSALVAKALGEGKKKQAEGYFSFFTYALIAIGVIGSVILWFTFEPLLSALGVTETMMPFCLTYGRILIPALTLFMLQFYFQSFLTTAKKPNLGLIFTILAGIANIVGDTILIGVLSQGDPTKAVSGAAISTAAGLIIGSIIPLIYFFSKNKSLLRLGKPMVSFKALAKACGNGSSEFFTNISGSIINIVYNSLFLYMIGDMGVAAFGTVGYVNSIFAAVASGLVLGITPLFSYNYGANNTKNLKNLYHKSTLIVIIIGIAATFLIEVLAQPLAAAFSHGDEALMQITLDGLMIFTLSFLFKGIPTFGSGLFTAFSNGKVSAIISIVRTLVFNMATVILVPIIFFIVFGSSYEAAFYGVWYSAVFSEFFAALMTIGYFKKYKKVYKYDD